MSGVHTVVVSGGRETAQQELNSPRVLLDVDGVDIPVFAERALPEPVGSMAKGSAAAFCQSGLPSRPCTTSSVRPPHVGPH